MMDHSKQTALEPEKEILESANLFWKDQLDINTPLIELPADFPRSATTSCRLDCIFSSVTAPFSDALKNLSRQLDTTLFTTLFSAYNTLLFRYTKQHDIIIGCPGFDDVVNDAGELVGTQRSTKVYRTDLSDNPGFNDLLKRSRPIVPSNKHQNTPYERLEETRLNDGIGAFNLIFSYRGAHFGANDINESISNILRSPDTRAEIDLALYAEETMQGINLVWTYNSELFEAATIERLSNHFEVLLVSIVSNPRQSISELPMLTTLERAELTLNWNTSKIAYPADKCIHQLFEQWAAETPGATALVYEKSGLSYSELNERANQLAHYLRSIGVERETLVPLCTGRSLEMIIGILGILKAGGAYVPIDPNYPLERIAYMLKDTNASLVICNKESKEQLKEACVLKNKMDSAGGKENGEGSESFKNVDIVELTADGLSLKGQPKENLNADVSSGNLAYIIYTSGSTGRPKGVMIEHRALADHCYGVIESAGLSACKSFALFSPLVFDAGHSIIHSAFILGASLHVLSEEAIMHSEKIAAYLENNTIDCIKIVPSLWLSYANLNKAVLAKKVMIFGGEAFHLGILGYLSKIGYSGKVYNHYGPTEITIGKSIYPVDIHKRYRTVPIGKPFANTQFYVLDEHFQLTPAGIEGELYVAGEGLARGYLNQPGLTAEKFIENPFSPGRMYKTGDKVRWLSDGNIEYLGRGDEQVKIQGHRIELGEIEDALLQNEAVRQAVVLANADKGGNKRLVAYVVPAKRFDKEAIIASLRKKLPEYMVPATCIALDALPLTKNGKINKKELEKLEETNKIYTAPQNETEAELAVIWQELLKIEKIGIHDDFFELGGNSVHAVILLTKVKKKYHKNLPLAFMFRARTIHQLAIGLKAETGPVVLSSSLVPIQPNGTKTPLFGVHAGLGDVLFYQSLSARLGQDQPFYGIQAKGLDGSELPSIQMEPMASKYISEMRKVQPEGPYYLAGYCLGARIVFEMARQLTDEGQKIALLANLNGISPTYRHQTKPINTEIKEPSKRGISKVYYHLNTLAKLSFKEKVFYIPNKIKKQLVHKLRKPYFALRYKANGLIFKVYGIFKRKVPGAIARTHVDQSLYMLQSKYRPKDYQGSMVIFRSPGLYTDPNLGWRDFVKGEIKTFDIPGDHKTRRDIMNEPFVEFVSKDLKSFLENKVD